MAARHMYHPTRAIIKRATPGSRPDYSGTVHKVGLKDIHTDEEHRIRTCVVDADMWLPASYTREKTIMLVGGTGCGKSSLIDAIMNYVAGVRYKDDFRLQLVDLMKDELTKVGNQTESQTDWLTCYTIPRMADSQVDCTLHLIDTPGFGDTRGMKRDEELMKTIRSFFRSDHFDINCIDAVCFVVKSNDARLTPSQKYIFEQVQSIFDKDIINNMFALVTFYDGNDPLVLKCMEKANIKCTHSVCFNNSALWKSGGLAANNDVITECFWKKGQESMASFFSELETRESHSLKLTREVLQERANLQAILIGLGDRIKAKTDLQSILLKEQERLTSLQKDSRKLMPRYEQRVRRVKIGKGVKWANNCLRCDTTCHAPCLAFSQTLLRKCEVMKDSHCQVCFHQCHVNVHKACNYKLETYIHTVEMGLGDEKVDKDTLVRKHKNSLESNRDELLHFFNKARKSANRLAQIALSQSHMGEIDYIDYCIATEKTERKEGWVDRLVVLENTKKLAQGKQEFMKVTAV